jgi:hypothetical protein
MNLFPSIYFCLFVFSVGGWAVGTLDLGNGLTNTHCNNKEKLDTFKKIILKASESCGSKQNKLLNFPKEGEKSFPGEMILASHVSSKDIVEESPFPLTEAWREQNTKSPTE